MWPESSDDEDTLIDDRDVSTEFPWLPWNNRPLLCSDITESTSLAHVFSAGLRDSQEEQPDCNASDLASVLSGTTYLENSVEHLFGHAGARDISIQICFILLIRLQGCMLLMCNVNCRLFAQEVHTYCTCMH